jgi:hypothetical protein
MQIYALPDSEASALAARHSSAHRSREMLCNRAKLANCIAGVGFGLPLVTYCCNTPMMKAVSYFVRPVDQTHWTQDEL